MHGIWQLISISIQFADKTACSLGGDGAGCEPLQKGCRVGVPNFPCQLEIKAITKTKMK